MSASPADPVGLLPDEWQEVMRARGEQPFRGKQIFSWIHSRGVMDPDQMTNLSKALRSALAEDGFTAPLAIERIHRSSDDSRKLLVRMADGRNVETVLLPVARPGLRDDADAAAAEDDEDSDESDESDDSGPSGRSARVTQCISTQVGCAMGCVFCSSGIAGLTRHMSAGEIVAQVLLGRAQLEPGERLGNVVFMGMGEPLHNYQAVARAIRLMMHPDGLAMSPRRLTISTSGLVPQIDQLAHDFEGRVGLAISLHNADDERRSALMPINQRHPLGELIAALRRYPLGPRRHITIEYTLVEGQNDAIADAERMARLLRRLRVKINLIPMNRIEHSDLGPPSMDRVEAFQRVLHDAGYLAFIRRRRGDDVAAACGQLVMLGAEPNKAFRKRQPS